jgi:FAD synthase
MATKENFAVLFKIEGIVQKGNGDASKLGFPTANLSCNDSIPSGIYAGEVIWKGVTYPAALYKENGKDSLEAHLLDFSGDLYGENMTFSAHKKIRDVKIFPTKEALIAAISHDIVDIKKLCSRE